jgi:hypothetical protein
VKGKHERIPTIEEYIMNIEVTIKERIYELTTPPTN